jgi:hypothetical protein
MEQQTKLLIFHNFFVIYQKLTPFSTKFLLIFEPLVPFFVSLFLRRKLEQLIKTGTINNYYLKIQRKSQFYYDVKFKLIATSKQVGNIIKNAINEVFSRLKI